MFNSTLKIKDFDPELWNAIAQEELRQEQHVELIASENHTSPIVMEAQGGLGRDAGRPSGGVKGVACMSVIGQSFGTNPVL